MDRIKNSKIKNRLREIINKYDPIGIYLDKETNFDEYDPEIEQILKVFNKNKNIKSFTKEIHRIFVRMFDENITGPILKYEKLAKEIYDFFKEYIAGLYRYVRTTAKQDEVTQILSKEKPDLLLLLLRCLKEFSHKPFLALIWIVPAWFHQA